MGVCEKIKAHLNCVFFPSSIKPLSFTFSFIKLNQDFENHKVFLWPANVLNISLLSICLMPLASHIGKSSESSVCPLVVHFIVVFIWHRCFFVFNLSKACHCHCALALCRILTWLFWGHTPYCFSPGPRFHCGARRVIGLFLLKQGNSSDWRTKANFSSRINSLRGHLLKGGADSCLCAACP